MSPKPLRRSRKGLHSQAFEELCELHIDAIRSMKDLVHSGSISVEELATLIKTTQEAITTHRATVIDEDDGAASDTDEDRLDSTTEGQRST